MKIFEYYNQEPKPGDVGLEVEVEYKPNKTLIMSPGGSWKAVEDHSIGYGLEYITRAPLKVGSTLYPKVKHLTDLFSPEMVIEDSTKAGVHVHVNVQEFTALQVWNAALIYWLIENVMVLFCGKHRMNNHFCLRMCKADGILATCYFDLNQNTSNPFAYFNQETVKYSSLNLATIQKLGTMEFRAMRATLNPSLICAWAETLHYMVNKAKDFKDPEAVMDHFMKCDKDTFLYSVLPSFFVTQLKNLPNYAGVNAGNKKVLAPLGYYINDWSEWHARVIDHAVKRKAKSPSDSPIQNFFNTTLQVNTAPAGAGYTYYGEDEIL